ncbi:hypothetical protein [Alicyclobacillus acidocaldarius]|uniref:hypothetical protein n=1 Tax=Alicyclobacillus acidocaldarius TaxID=405212 RepID=UPI001C54DB1E|nr:hypothetical protein [Alicyclobacillus acidocaldarius]
MSNLQFGEDIDACLEQIQNVRDEIRIEDASRIIVNISFGFTSPCVLTAVTAFLLELKHHCNGNLHCCVNGYEDYLSRVNFFQILNIPYEERFRRHDEQGRFIPLTHFTREEEVYGFSRRASQVLKTQGAIIDNIIPIVDYSLNEILGNVFIHARSPYGAIAFVMTRPKLNITEICIADSGLGIPNTLRQNPRYSHLSDLECLEKSLEFGVTGGNGQGNGLYHVRRFIEENRGVFKIYSPRGMLCMNNGNISVCEKHRWQGTLLHMEINRLQFVNVERVYGKDHIPTDVLDYMMDDLW